MGSFFPSLSLNLLRIPITLHHTRNSRHQQESALPSTSIHHPKGSGQGILFLSSLCFSTKVSGQGLDCYAESVFRIANSILSSALRHMLQL
ncbi:hypothetical protein D5086_007696 [Populus alba]|uniref:Uncharacterized protein n=1 Tax=Populus alba TaxID=43335 RepID=A0ACC4CDL3_POPAL